jgi:glycosyltransferase involved in cell wall biosynthesis
MKVSILLLTIDRFELTKKVLGIILRNCGYSDFELLVCDNGSADKRTVQYIKSLNPYYFRENNENKGIGAMYNHLLGIARGKYFCIIDNDIMLPDNWLADLVMTYEKNKNAGILGFKCVEGNNKNYVYGTKFFSRERWEEVGGFNEKYGLYGLEDSDFNKRMISNGYKNYYIGKSDHLGVGEHDSGEYRKMKDEALRKAWVMDTNIPRRIHQIWVGPHPKPAKLMQTWKDKHKDWDFFEWNNETIKKITFANKRLIEQMWKAERWHGVADLIRYEVLYKYGGFVAPADSVCLNSIDDLLSFDSFSCYENELMRPGLVSPHIGCTIKNQLIKLIIEELKERETVLNDDPWKVTGNLLLTHMIIRHNYKDMKILPSYTFLPEHYTGNKYEGEGKIYAKHIWGTTHNINNNLDNYAK